MQPPLTDVEARILGSLIEKEATTPDNYPLSMNALLAACNQTTNRDPVMRLGEGAVAPATVTLRRGGLLRQIQPVGSRVTKFEHLLAEELSLDPRHLAVLGVLLLRGPQTPGELNARVTRRELFAGLADVEAVLESMIAREPAPLVARLARRPGQKEVRYAHLLGETAPDEVPGEAPGEVEERPVVPRRAEEDAGRVAALERTVDELRREVAALRAELDAFRAQFQ